MDNSRPALEQLTPETARSKKAIGVFTLLFIIEISLIALAAVSGIYLNSMGVGAIIFILPLFALYGTILTMLIVVPIFAILAISKKHTRTKRDYIIVWLGLSLNVVALIAIITAVIVTVIHATSS